MRAQGTNRHRTRKLAAVKCYKGGLAAVNAAGYLTPATDTAGLVVVGVFEETVDNSAGVAGDLSAAYITGVEVELDNAAGAIVQGTLKAVVSDDHSVTTAAVAVNDIAVGNVTEFTAASAWVFIDERVNVG
jgi:hypothetical protein